MQGVIQDVIVNVFVFPFRANDTLVIIALPEHSAPLTLKRVDSICNRGFVSADNRWNGM